MKTSILLAAALPLALAAPAAVTNDAPIIAAREGFAIPGKYIVKMKNDAAQEIIEKAIAILSKEPQHRYGFGNFKGFAAEIRDDIVEILKKLPGVRHLSAH